MKHKCTTLYALFFTLSLFAFSSARAQYCTPLYSNGCTFDDDINSFTLNGVGASTISDLNTGCSTAGYSNRTAIVPVVNLQQGGIYAGTITTDYSGDEYVHIWIDFNNDQTFAASEEVSSFGPFGSVDGNFPFTVSIPFSAPVANGLRMRVRLAYNASPANSIDPCTSYSFGETHDYLVNILATPPCSGAPTPGTIVPAGPITACAGSIFNLTATGTTFATGLTYQWEQSTDGGITWMNAVGGVGATTLFYTTPALNITTMYRLNVYCGIFPGTTTPITINVTAPAYATPPYLQDFENWVNYCDISDVPSLNWLNIPKNGDASWRRDDQGSTAAWSSTGGNYLPASSQGSHSARYHSWDAGFGNPGTLDVFVNCSPFGNKELQFSYINPSGSDQLDVLLSTDGGATFTTLSSYFVAASWQFISLPFTSTSAQTIIRFRGNGDYSEDLGIDDVKVLGPCAGMPTAGTVNPLTPCSGQNFNLSLVGNTSASMLTYFWEQSADNINWTPVPGGTSLVSTTSITAPTYFRCTVTCLMSTLAATTPSVLFNLAPFYHCYCQSYAQYDFDEDIGNVTITPSPSGTAVLNNGLASPLTFNTTATNLYTDFTALPPATLYKLSPYKYSVTQIDQSFFYNAYVGVYIDFNGSGVFDPNEQVLLQTTSDFSSPPQEVHGIFTIPDSPFLGITGMRVVLVDGTFQAPDPCGNYFAGETEDYLVNINPAKCTGAPAAGLVHISDSVLCVADTTVLIDTTHTKGFSGISTVWESSLNGTTWTAIAGSANKDTFTATIPGDVYYRFKITCLFSGNLSSVSNVKHVTLKAPYKCYCKSYANGGVNDASDISAFSVGNFVTNSGGPHLSNVTAIRPYTDYTDNGPAILFADSSYYVSVYHTLKGASQIDAKVTMFIDYNNNWQYDLPDELVWTGYTDFVNTYIHANILIPNTAVKNVITGLRVILNNDVAPNVPSDQACGPYTSGETEDYIVMIKAKNEGVNDLGFLQNLIVYPNPTEGKCIVAFSAKQSLKDVTISVTNITGQQIQSSNYHDVAGQFQENINLSNQAKGVYFIEIKADGERTVKKIVVR